MIFLMIFGWLLGIGGVALHLFTVLIAFERYGFLSATIAFVMPFIAQMYFVFKTITVTGAWINFYTFWVACYLAACAAWAVLAVLSERLRRY